MKGLLPLELFRQELDPSKGISEKARPFPFQFSHFRISQTPRQQILGRNCGRPIFPCSYPLFTDLYLGEVGPSTAPSKKLGQKEESICLQGGDEMEQGTLGESAGLWERKQGALRGSEGLWEEVSSWEEARI